MVDARDRSLGFLPRLLLTDEGAAALGFSDGAGDVVVRTPEDLTKAQRNLIADLALDIEDEPLADRAESPGDSTATMTSISVSYVDSRPPALLLDGILSGVALLLTLFVVAMALGLAASESRDQRDILTVVGAAPTTLRRTSARKAAILTALGAVLAVPVGVLPVFVPRLSCFGPSLYWRCITLIGS